MSTPVFIDPEIFTQTGGAQSSRVPVPLPEDPYEAIRQAYLVGTDAEFEPFEDLVKTETPESPHTVGPPTCHVKKSEGSGTFGARSMSSYSIALLFSNHPLTHTTPILVLFLCRNACMAVCVPPVMSHSLSISIAKVAAMPDLAFCKRFRSSYNSSPSLTFLVQKRYRGTSKLILDTDSEGDELGDKDDKEDEEEDVKESSCSDSESEDAEDEGPTIKDEDPAVGDEGLVRAALIVETAMGEPLRLGYEALRCQEIALGEGLMPSVFEVGQSFGFVPESKRPERVSALKHPTLTPWIDPKDAPYIVPSPISSPIISLTIPWSVASPATAKAKGFLTELGAQVEMQGGLIRDHTVQLGDLSPALFKRSLEHEQERVVVTFRVIWRPVLAVESWIVQADAYRAALWHAISDT
uniref:Uncharacterized protein n=1 Tax=Tanacetum cinerariifolium TaxID=118510 RepID=A0A699HMH0_TANCI|nr:hypothetical protein [Tanacetum cinerariifolium]